jgi:hypothetical protein
MRSDATRPARPRTTDYMNVARRWSLDAPSVDSEERIEFRRGSRSITYTVRGRART